MGKKITARETVEAVSDSAKKLADNAKNMVGLSKEKTAAIHKDVDAAIDWVSKRNKALQTEGAKGNEATVDNLPALGKVIFGGEEGIKQLPVGDRTKYIEYFKKNGTRLAALTVTNPIWGFGTIGAEAAATGLVSTKAAIGTASVGAGMAGASTIAAASIPSCLSASAMTGLSVIPGLQLVGIGLLALGTGATLFKAIEKLPQGKRIAELFTETQNLHNECYMQVESNIAKIGDILSNRFKNAAEKLEATSKRIAISIDDIVHSDQNLRVMQYNEILLGLFNNQAAISKIQSEIFETLSQICPLIAENEELSKKINEHRINLQLLVCGAEYLK